MASQWLSRLAVRLIRCIGHTSPQTRNALAKMLSFVLWHAAKNRRKVVLTNLRLCFPQMSEDERVALARRNGFYMARALLDYGVFWEGSREQIESMVEVEGFDILLESAKEPLILVTPHFLGLEVAPVYFNPYIRGVGLYQQQSNSVFNEAVVAGRRRFGDPVLIPKSHDNDLMTVVREIRKGLPFYYLPDQDHGRKHSIFVPFFGVQAATLPMASRLARVTRARVCLVTIEITRTGYRVRIAPPLEDFPTRDVEADTRRISEETEKAIRAMPEQYLWAHRRFKTRPEGEPSVYN